MAEQEQQQTPEPDNTPDVLPQKRRILRSVILSLLFTVLLLWSV